MSKVSLLGLCVLVGCVGVALASEPQKKAKPGKQKLTYTLSNNSTAELIIHLEAYEPGVIDPVKIYTDKVKPRSTKTMHATVYPGHPFGSINVVITRASLTLLDRGFSISPIPTLENGEGVPRSEFVYPPSEEIDIAYNNGDVIWSVNPN